MNDTAKDVTADALMDRNVLITARCCSWPGVARAALKLGQKTHRKIVPIHRNKDHVLKDYGDLVKVSSQHT
jgi:hypothetical protein